MKIFWSWQSDHHGAISRHFVRDALEEAITALNEALAIDEPEREVSLDHDRKGVPGSPDLANVILEKIRNCDVFVADVTPVGGTIAEPPRKLMNPNVAIELGYALNTISDRRLLMVLNSTFGDRADLPFDLQHKAGPIFYRLARGATKKEIAEARKQLAAEFKVALREILSSLAPSEAPFQPTPSRADDPSRYFAVGQFLAIRQGPFGGGPQPFSVPEMSTLYLRLMPTRRMSPLKRAEAYDVIRKGPDQLSPFYVRSGSSFESNEFGAIVFEANYEEREIQPEIQSAAQLFLNREIWAFNIISLSRELAASLGKKAGIPTLTVEQTFATMLPEYVKFMKAKLGVDPPYRIEAGASDVRGHVIFMPSNYVEREWGPIQQRHIQWSGTLSSPAAKEVDGVLLAIFEAFFDAGACTRPKGLYGFPGETPGTIPR